MYRIGFIFFIFLSFSTLAAAHSSKINKVEIKVELFGTSETQDEFMESEIKWLPEGEWSREAKGLLKIKVGQAVNLGMVSIIVKETKVKLRYQGSLSAQTDLSLSTPSNCQKTCEQVFEFRSDDGDFPVGGKLKILFLTE